MAALVAILKAVRRAVGRDLGTLQSIKVNNLFLFVALLSYGALNSGQPPKSSYPFFVLLAGCGKTKSRRVTQLIAILFLSQSA
jgi:hypothetical protein